MPTRSLAPPPAQALFSPMLRPKQRQRQREGKRNLLVKTGARKSPAKKTTASGSCILRLGRHKKVSSSSDTYSEPSLSRRGGEQRGGKWVRISLANVSRLRSEQTPGQRGHLSRISPTSLPHVRRDQASSELQSVPREQLVLRPAWGSSLGGLCSYHHSETN